MSCPFISFSISPTSSPQSVWSHEITVWFYVPISHLSCTGIFWLDSWFIDQVGQLTHCYLVLYHCISHQCGSSRRSRLQGCLLWPWKLPLDPFGPPHLWRWVEYSIFWTLPYWDSLWLLQTRCLSWCWMHVTWVWSDPSTLQMLVAGPQHASWTLVVETQAVHLPYVLEID